MKAQLFQLHTKNKTKTMLITEKFEKQLSNIMIWLSKASNTVFFFKVYYLQLKKW